jgi:hypothetical protein
MYLDTHKLFHHSQPQSHPSNQYKNQFNAPSDDAKKHTT